MTASSRARRAGAGAHFDLLAEPWIPCLDCGGQLRYLGLRDALVEAHRLREIAHGDSILTAAALRRLLLALALRVFAPEGPAEWEKLWRAGAFSARRIDRYLATWRKHFDLFHPETPFYQTPQLGGGLISAANLPIEWATGVNATLWDHHRDAETVIMPPAAAARYLVTLQTFAIGFGNSTHGSMTDGPWTRGIIYFLEGDNVFESLLLNLLPAGPGLPAPGDVPVWERADPCEPAEGRPSGPLDYLTFPARRVWLEPRRVGDAWIVSRVKRAQGLRLNAAPPGEADPFKAWRRYARAGSGAPRRARDGRALPEVEELPVRIDRERGLWACLPPLVALREHERPPASFAWARQLVAGGRLAPSASLRYLAVTLVTSSERPALIEGTRSAVMPLPAAYLHDEALLAALGHCAHQAEAIHMGLYGVARAMTELRGVSGSQDRIKQDTQRLGARLRQHFWSRLEMPFRQALVTLPADPAGARQVWRAAVAAAAWAALEGQVASWEQSLAAMQAVTRGRAYLAGSLARLEPEEETG